MKLSVAIVVHKTNLWMLKNNISSLVSSCEFLNQRIPTSLSIYVIDNSLSESYFCKLKEMLNEFIRDGIFSIQTLKLESNRGYGYSNNCVGDLLESDYHLVLNPDVGLEPDTLFEAVCFMRENEETAVLSPSVEEKFGSITHVSKSYPDCFTLLLRYLNFSWLKKKFLNRLNDYSMTNLSKVDVSEVELVGGCFMFFRTRDFLLIGGFDPRFFMYFEDFDLSIRMKSLGRISYVPNVRVSHEGGDVGRKHIRHHFYFALSAIKFFNKHGWKIA